MFMVTFIFSEMESKPHSIVFVVFTNQNFIEWLETTSLYESVVKHITSVDDHLEPLHDKSMSIKSNLHLCWPMANRTKYMLIIYIYNVNTSQYLRILLTFATRLSQIAVMVILPETH